MATYELADAIHRSRWTGEDGKIVKMTTQVGGEIRDGAVATSAVLLQRLHRDPVEVSMKLTPNSRCDGRSGSDETSRGQRGNPCARTGRIDLTDHTPDFVERFFPQGLRVER